MAGIERRRRQRSHRLEVAFEALPDALAMPAKYVALALAAAPLQILVERFEARKVRQRDHEVAPRPAHQALHRPLGLSRRLPLIRPGRTNVSGSRTHSTRSVGGSSRSFSSRPVGSEQIELGIAIEHTNLRGASYYN